MTTKRAAHAAKGRSTHRSKPLDSLADCQRQLQLFMTNVREVVYRYELMPAPRMRFISPAALPVMGYTPEAFYRDPELPFSVLHPDDRALGRRMRSHPQEFTGPVVMRWRHADGTLVWAEHVNAAVYAPDGTLVAIEGVARDITESLRIRQQLRISEDQLRRLAGRLQTAREDDRATLSRELHDDVGQTFTSLRLELSHLTSSLKQTGLALRQVDQIQAIMGLVDVGAERVRRLASNLRPPALDHLGLAAAIEFEAAEVRRRTGIRVRIAGGDAASGLDREQDTGVFRIVQEALTNTVRHANASAVAIRFKRTANAFALRITDNGRGIRPEQLNDPDAFGLLGMRERAQLIGGQLAVTGRPGRGTTVSLSVPVRTDREERT